MIEEGLQNILDFIFYTNGVTETALIKLSLFLMVFFAVFKGTERVFRNQKRAIPMLIAAIIAFTGIRLMPEEWLTIVSGAYGLIIGLALVLGPYILISIICDLIRVRGAIKWILVIAAYAAIIYCLPAFGLPEFGSEMLNTLFRYASDNRPMAALMFMVVLVIIIYVRRKMGTGSFLGSVGRAGTGAVRGTGSSAMRGMRYLGGGAASGFGAGSAAGTGWFQRRAQAQRAKKEAMAEIARKR